MRNKRIAVLGTGLMGKGIAHTFAINDFHVDLYGHSEGFQEQVLVYLQYEEEKGRLTETERQKILGNLRLLKMGRDYEELRHSSLVIEAVKEDKDLKKEIFQMINQYTFPNTMIASNTSTFSITELASATKTPEKVVGMHFISPVPKMKLVEIVKGYRTEEEVVENAKAIVRQIGKNPCVVKDNPGFVFTRLFVQFVNEAANVLSEGVIDSPQQLDQMMMDGMGLAVGPLKLIDLTGVDIIYNSMKSMYDHLHDSKFSPSLELKKMMDAGFLGRKAGKGFYHYTDEEFGRRSRKKRGEIIHGKI